MRYGFRVTGDVVRALVATVLSLPFFALLVMLSFGYELNASQSTSIFVWAVVSAVAWMVYAVAKGQ